MPTNLSDEPTAPHCIRCGATATRESYGWLTIHDENCPTATEPDE